MNARRVIAARAVVALLLLPSGRAAAEPLAADLLISGGEVHDGTGAPARTVDVAVRGDRIIYVGPEGEHAVKAERTIDADGLLVVPGFIDPHTHADGELSSDDPARRSNRAYLRQGVTTVVIGNDGGGSPDIADTAAAFEEAGIGTNVGFMVGFGAVRKEVVGEADRAPTADELAAMKRKVASAVCEGAIGFSTGLHYAPQSFAATDEIVALAAEAGKRGAIYDSHLRDESSYSVGLEASVAEALGIGRAADTPVHIAHIKALGPDVWGSSGRIIAMVEEAQARGQRVTADQYPWRASGTRISGALVPRWALDGGMEGLRARFDDPEVAERLRAEMAENLRRRGGADTLLVTRGFGEAAKWDGRTLEEIAAATGADAISAAVAILRKSDARVASFNMNQADIDAFAARPWVMTGSDGSTGHPRKYATYPKAYRDLVTSGKMALPAFMRRSSGLVADTLGLENRGYIREGGFADIAVIDPARFAPRADYADPEVPAEGVAYLLVNGALAIDGERVTDTRAGRPLLHRPLAHACQETDR